MKPTVFIGIDPGQTGSICAVRVRDLEIEMLEDIPNYEDHNIDPQALGDLLRRFSRRRAAVYCEGFIHAYNPKSTFNVGVVYGVANMAIQYRPVLVAPASWQRYTIWDVPEGMSDLESHRKSTKRRSLALAKAIWPEADIQHDGQSDALLLALYGMMECELIGPIIFKGINDEDESN